MNIATVEPRKNLVLILSTLLLISLLGVLVGINIKSAIYIAGLIGALVYLFLCIIKPFAAFGLLIFLGLLVWLSSIPFIGNFSMLIGVGMVFISVWAMRLLTRKTRLTLLREFWLLFALLLVIGLSTLLNWGGPAGLGSSFTYVQLVLLAVLVVNFTVTPAQLRSLGYILVLASTLIALMILLDQAGILPEGMVIRFQSTVTFEGSYDHFERSGGIWGDPNFSALQLLVALPFILELWGESAPWQKAMLLVSSLMILGAFRYTFSMGGLMGLVMILLLKTLIVEKRNFIKLTLQVTLMGLIGWWLVLNFLPEYYWARILVNFDIVRGFLNNHDLWSFLKLGTTRGDTWLAALKVFSQSPIWGHGPGNSVYLIPAYSVFHSYLPLLGAHNFLLTIAGDFGLTGLLIFIAIILLAVRSCWPGNNVETPPEPIRNAVFIALVSTVVQGMAIDLQSQKLLWVLLGMAFVIKRLSTTAVAEEKLITAHIAQR